MMMEGLLESWGCLLGMSWYFPRPHPFPSIVQNYKSVPTAQLKDSFFIESQYPFLIRTIKYTTRNAGQTLQERANNHYMSRDQHED